MKTIIKANKQKGFSILAVILVTVAIIVALGLWAVAETTSSSSSSGNTTADIQASLIISDSNAIKVAYDNLINAGNAPSSITFVPGSSAGANILDPVNGPQLQKVNPTSLKASPATTDGIWIYSTKINGYNVGTSADDAGVFMVGIKDTVCKRINNTLTGSETIISSASWANATLVGSATVAAPTSSATFDLSTATNTSVIGCVASGTADNNVFFRILKAN